MNNFEFYNSTRIIFGKGTIAKLTKRVPRKAKVMLIYGGGSIKENGVYDQVMDALKKHKVVEFSGIEANPRLHHAPQSHQAGAQKACRLPIGGWWRLGD